MTDFLINNLPTPPDKVDRWTPTGSPDEADAADWNFIFAALRSIQANLRTTILNVKVFGAKGDGVTIDNAAIDAALAAAAVKFPDTATGPGFGAWVLFPPGVYMYASTFGGIQQPNGVGICGAGPSASTIKCTASFNAQNLLANKNQNGTQEFAFIRDIAFDGNRGAGALCNTAVVEWIGLFTTSYMKNVLIENGSNSGLHVGAVGSPGGTGPVLFDTIWLENNMGHGLFVEEMATNAGACTGLVFVNVASEHQGSNKSAVYLKGLGTMNNILFNGLHIEQGPLQPNGAAATGRTCITFDGVFDVTINHLSVLGTPSTVTDVVKVTNVASNVGLEIKKLTNPNLLGNATALPGTTVVNDLKNGVTITNPFYNLRGWCTPDCVTFGGQRFAATSGSVACAMQDSTGTDRMWWDVNGRIKGNGQFQASCEIVANPIGTPGSSDERALMIMKRDATNAFFWHYPNGGGGAIQERFSSGSLVRQMDTSGNQFFYGNTTNQGSLQVKGNIGFFNHAVAAKPTVTGSKGANAALGSLLTALAGLGLLTDSST